MGLLFVICGKESKVDNGIMVITLKYTRTSFCYLREKESKTDNVVMVITLKYTRTTFLYNLREREISFITVIYWWEICLT